MAAVFVPVMAGYGHNTQDIDWLITEDDVELKCRPTNTHMNVYTDFVLH